MRLDLTPKSLLTAYANGIFPMADEDGEILWLTPDRRAILELDAFKIPRSLRAVLRRGRFTVTVNRAFAEVIAGCADRPDGTWISPAIHKAYTKLYRLGFAHSVEAWQEDTLAGGLYGVAIGGAFFGESMFHRVPEASKVALVCLVERLRRRGFRLLDVQFQNPHLRRFGAVEIPRRDYERRLRDAIGRSCEFVDDASTTEEDLVKTSSSR